VIKYGSNSRLLVTVSLIKRMLKRKKKMLKKQQTLKLR